MESLSGDSCGRPSVVWKRVGRKQCLRFREIQLKTEIPPITKIIDICLNLMVESYILMILMLTVAIGDSLSLDGKPRFAVFAIADFESVVAVIAH